MTAEPGTRILKADPEAIEAAARCLAAGGLVAFPTETVYGLGADAGNGEAVARLYAAKGRPAFNPLIAHVADVAAARRVGVFTAAAEKLAAAFWPGPLTLVLAKQPDCVVADLALAGLDSVAVRVPAHPVARNLIEAFGGPVVAPSANRSGHVSPTSAAHVLADLRGRIDLIIDARPLHRRAWSSPSCPASSSPTLLRPGGLPREAIEAHARRRARNGTRSPTTHRSRPACCRRITRRRPRCVSMRDGAENGRSAARLRHSAGLFAARC